MSLASRRDLARVTKVRYRCADRCLKARILDEFVEATGYHRKYAISVLSAPETSAGAASGKPRRRPRSRQYGTDVARALLSIWRASGYLCSKRLLPFLADLLDALDRHGELDKSLFPSEVRAKLLTISAATCDRLLAPQRHTSPLRGKTTTKPGTLLKHQVPIRTFADWLDSEKRPGFCEIDLVAHCGDTTAGEYVHTLTVTDVFTGWTECQPIVNRGQAEVSAAIEAVRKRLPFALLGIDSDNGSEFINGTLLRYCKQNQITFTRCRPYKKNDQCHVEQKNWAVVRQYVGYARMEGEAFVHLLSRCYLRLRLHLNYFQPSVKLVSKERHGARVKKSYDTAATPFRRLLAWLKEQPDTSPEQIQRHEEIYRKLNPAELIRTIETAQTALAQRSIAASAERKASQTQPTGHPTDQPTNRPKHNPERRN